jgi:hypothetical protein
MNSPLLMLIPPLLSWIISDWDSCNLAHVLTALITVIVALGQFCVTKRTILQHGLDFSPRIFVSLGLLAQIVYNDRASLSRSSQTCEVESK